MTLPRDLLLYPSDDAHDRITGCVLFVVEHLRLDVPAAIVDFDGATLTVRGSDLVTGRTWQICHDMRRVLPRSYLAQVLHGRAILHALLRKAEALRICLPVVIR